MARIRTIKPEFWEDEKLAELPVHARLLFIGTWNFADDNGVLLANPVLMKSHIFPYEDIGISTISEWIDRLADSTDVIKTAYFRNDGSICITDDQRINTMTDVRNKKGVKWQQVR